MKHTYLNGWLCALTLALALVACGGDAPDAAQVQDVLPPPQEPPPATQTVNVTFQVSGLASDSQLRVLNGQAELLSVQSDGSHALDLQLGMQFLFQTVNPTSPRQSCLFQSSDNTLSETLSGQISETTPVLVVQCANIKTLALSVSGLASGQIEVLHNTNTTAIEGDGIVNLDAIRVGTDYQVSVVQQAMGSHCSFDASSLELANSKNSSMPDHDEMLNVVCRKIANPNQLYGRFNLAWTDDFGVVQSHHVFFQEAHLKLSETEPTLEGFFASDMSWFLTCSPIDSLARNYAAHHFLCIAMDQVANASLLSFWIDQGQLRDGRYAYCSALQDGSVCANRLLTAAPGLLTGAVVTDPGARSRARQPMSLLANKGLGGRLKTLRDALAPVPGSPTTLPN